MKHEDAIELIKVLNSMNFNENFICMTLVYCEQGMGIGHAMREADKHLNQKSNE